MHTAPLTPAQQSCLMLNGYKWTVMLHNVGVNIQATDESLPHSTVAAQVDGAPLSHVCVCVTNVLHCVCIQVCWCVACSIFLHINCKEPHFVKLGNKLFHGETDKH